MRTIADSAGLQQGHGQGYDLSARASLRELTRLAGTPATSECPLYPPAPAVPDKCLDSARARSTCSANAST